MLKMDKLEEWKYLSESQLILNSFSSWPYYSGKTLGKIILKSVAIYTYILIDRLYIFIHPRIEKNEDIDSEYINIQEIIFNKTGYLWYKEITKEIKSWWSTIKINNYVIAGIGVGGLVAQYLALSIKGKNIHLNILCYNFGTPMPGDKRYCTMFEKSNINLVNIFLENDLRVLAPPNIKYPLYQRISTEKKIKLPAYNVNNNIDQYLNVITQNLIEANNNN